MLDLRTPVPHKKRSRKNTTREKIPQHVFGYIDFANPGFSKTYQGYPHRCPLSR